MDSRDYIILAVLFIIAFYVWSIPLQNSPLPYGEADSAWHFSIGDYQASHDTVLGIKGYPLYISWWYWKYNSLLGADTQEYPPPNHINYAISQIVGGERVVPVFIYRIIVSFLGVFTTYFLLRKLFGIFPATLAGFGLIFSIREFQSLIFGQQPTLTSLLISPIFIYAYYKFLNSWLDGKADIKYMYASLFILLSQYLLHFQGIVVSLSAVIVYTIYMLIKKRKIPLGKNTITHFGYAGIIALLVTAPFFVIYYGAPSEFYTNENASLGRLFSWTLDYELIIGNYPPSFVDIFTEYGNRWSPLFGLTGLLGWMTSLPGLFFLIGIIVLLMRRKPQDILILSWLFGVYLFLHFDSILGVSFPRIARMLIAEPPMMFSIMAIGVVAIPNLVGLKSQVRFFAKIGLSILFIYIIWTTIGEPQLALANGVYPAPFRLTDEEIAATVWMRDNIPEASVSYLIGPETYPKSRWMLAFSQKHVNLYSGSIRSNPGEPYGAKYYFIFDYTSVLSQSQSSFEQMAQVEQQLGATPIYSTQKIRIYEVRPPDE